MDESQKHCYAYEVRYKEYLLYNSVYMKSGTDKMKIFEIQTGWELGSDLKGA